MKKIILIVFVFLVVGVAHSLTFEQRVLKAMKRGNYKANSVEAIADTLISLRIGVKRDTSALRDSVQTELRRMATIGYLYHGNNVILLTNTGSSVADLVP